MVLLIGNLRRGLLSMIPNLLPIWLVAGPDGLCSDIPLDNSTLLVGCVLIGLAVDDTIHFMHKFQRYYAVAAETPGKPFAQHARNDGRRAALHHPGVDYGLRHHGLRLHGERQGVRPAGQRGGRHRLPRGCDRGPGPDGRGHQGNPARSSGRYSSSHHSEPPLKTRTVPVALVAQRTARRMQRSVPRSNSLVSKELAGGPGQNRTADTLIFSLVRDHSTH